MRFVLIYSLFLMAALPALSQEKYTLRKALRTAKYNNQALKAEKVDIDIARADVLTASLRPNLILTNETLQLIQSRHFEANSKWHSPYNREVLWQLGKPIQIANQRKNKIETAAKEAELSQKNYLETERNLLAEVAGKWLDVWTAQKQLDILQIAKSNIDSLVRSNEIRFKNEVITKTDLFRTELLAKQYAIQYRTSLQEVVNHQNELKFLLGIQGYMEIDTADRFSFGMPNDIESLFEQSLHGRSDMHSARKLIDLWGSNIKLQKSLAYPQPELGLLWNPQNKVPYFGIYASIELPFFNRNQGEIRKSFLLKEQADDHLNYVKAQIRSEVTTAYADFKLQQQNIESFQQVLQQSKTILDNVKYSYLKGGTTIIDFLEAQRSWLETQQQYYEALQQLRRATIQLLYTTGTINQLAL